MRARTRLLGSALRRATFLAAAMMLCGCSELVLEGIVSDRENGRPLPSVQIDQKRAEQWRSLGETDGKGRYWIMKHGVHGGGPVRLAKQGYHSTEIKEGDFLTGQSFLLIPSETQPDAF